MDEQVTVEQSDHDLLIILNERVDQLTKRFETYIKQRWALTLMAVSAAFTGLISLLVGVLLMIVSRGGS